MTTYDNLKNAANDKIKMRHRTIYESVNKKIDENAEASITMCMSRGETSWIVFQEDYISSINYTHIFNDYYKAPYNKPIVARLKELFPEPDFRCICEDTYISSRATNGYRPAEHYYTLKVDWSKRDDCQCAIF